MQRCRSLAHDASGRRYCDGNNCRGAKRAGNIMHTVRIDDAAPGYIVRKSVLIHIGPAIAATAGIARSVNICEWHRLHGRLNYKVASIH